jgi:hypothetical protein
VAVIKTVLSRVTVNQRQIRLRIELAGFAKLLGHKAAADPEAAADFKSAQLDIDVPMSIRRRGVETRIEGAGLQSKTGDRVLVDLIGRAHLVLRRLTDG